MASEDNDDKPFECNYCKKKFSKHDTMIAHNLKHNLDLDLSRAGKQPNLQFTDQTPTPTSIIRHGDEVGLFNDLKSVGQTETNPFDIAFRKEISSQLEVDDSQHSLDVNDVVTVLETPQPSLVSTGKKRKFHDVVDDSNVVLPLDSSEVTGVDVSPNYIQMNHISHGNTPITNIEKDIVNIQSATDGASVIAAKNEEIKPTTAIPTTVQHQLQPLSVQLMLPLANGGVIPISIPAQIGQPVQVSGSCTTPFSAGSPISSGSESSKSSFAKQKLKEAIRSGNSAATTPTEDVRLCTSFVSERRPISFGFSNKPVKSAADTSTPTESSRGFGEQFSGSEDVEDKKKQYLERNRAAAARSRAKKKKIMGDLERKYDEAKRSLQQYQKKICQLEKENASLKRMLLQHSNCIKFESIERDGDEPVVLFQQTIDETL
ncbi:DgyrCDS7504 [Dimorphilus gyrociliatus]|uniref:DgyrCDS7504 n=1 Tax=Dimorphilus gyrociliatus TaxID=2664684 RepID=A0A7I8VS66_9ANNE|nr:DgyrCDS7504 [Dimorphilus gyrociliatus]